MCGLKLHEVETHGLKIPVDVIFPHVLADGLSVHILFYEILKLLLFPRKHHLPFLVFGFFRSSLEELELWLFLRRCQNVLILKGLIPYNLIFYNLTSCNLISYNLLS